MFARIARRETLFFAVVVWGLAAMLFCGMTVASFSAAERAGMHRIDGRYHYHVSAVIAAFFAVVSLGAFSAFLFLKVPDAGRAGILGL